MKAVDTNVLVRYLTRDDAKQAAAASKFLDKECSRESPAYINRIVLCELIWVLSKHYGYSRDQLITPLELILRTAEFVVEDLDAAWRALDLCKRGACDFADGYLAYTNIDQECQTTFTFDKMAGKLDVFEAL